MSPSVGTLTCVGPPRFGGALVAVVVLALAGCASASQSKSTAESGQFSRPTTSLSATLESPTEHPVSSPLPRPRRRLHLRFSVPGERAYAWADSNSAPFAGGATIALVHGMSPREVLTVLAPDAVVPVGSPARAEDWAARGSYQQVRNVIEARPLPNDWTLVVNEIGYRATQHEYLRRLSSRGTALVIYEDVNLLGFFQYARGGSIMREFDPNGYGRPWIGKATRAEKAIRFGDRHDYHSMAKSLLLASRLTGVRLTLGEVDSQADRLAVGVRA